MAYSSDVAIRLIECEKHGKGDMGEQQCQQYENCFRQRAGTRASRATYH
jgi:hypothetical protein